ncbi:hypothetical protein ACLQ2R_34035 [Streptosporangium sp. DT93]|uniref:hypothetical protein n=1 Tax=Streptosporangium sp. DT93 TaxID=3393428 RepID=UPI003CF5AB04
MTSEIRPPPPTSGRPGAGEPPAPAPSAPAPAARDDSATVQAPTPVTHTRAPVPGTSDGRDGPDAREPSDSGTPGAQETLPARIRQLAEAVGPTTLVTALLVYFGYLATRGRFDYFGVSLELTGLSNQNLLLYGLEVVHVPAALLCLGALPVIGVHAAVSARLARHPGDVTNTFLAAGIALVGVLLTGRAMIGIFLEDPSTSVVIGTTPLALASGPATVAYGLYVHGRNRDRPLMSPRLARYGVVSVLGLAAAGLLWALTTIAWAYGIGRGEQDAHELPRRAEVVLDVKEPLRDVPPGITHIPLTTTGKDPGFAHRYRGFRLLLASGGRLFLVNPAWKLGRDQTIVVPYDGSIRIQLISQP